MPVKTTRKRWDCRFDAAFAELCRQAYIASLIHEALKGV
jgi:hypothetical protein